MELCIRIFFISAMDRGEVWDLRPNLFIPRGKSLPDTNEI